MSSGTTSYCSAAQAIQCLDVRHLGQWLSDTTVELTSAQVLASPILDHFLKSASGEIEMACLVGGRYTPTDLVALSGTNHGALLATLVAWLALKGIWGRRVRTSAEALPSMCEWAMRTLEELRLGKAIFAVTNGATEEAGRMNHKTISAVDMASRGLWSDRAQRYFGVKFADDPL